MKKTFHKLLAATVAIPVALGQVLSMGAVADNAPSFTVTTKDLLHVNAETGFPTEEVTADTTTFSFEQVSTWNEYVQERIDKIDGKTLNVNAKEIVGSLNATSYYAGLIKDFVEASENPTAKVDGETITIEGTADFSAYLAPELEEKFASKEGYEDVTINTDILKDITYTATITTDLDNKSASADFGFKADGKDYTVATAAEFLTAVYENLSAQVDAAVDQKVKDLAAEYHMTEQEVLDNADFDIDGDKAALKEVTDKLATKIKQLTDNLSKVQTLNIESNTYDSADAALAAAKDYATKNSIIGASYIPSSVDAGIAKIGNTFDSAVASFNTSLEEADVNVQIAVSASDIASVLKSASSVTAGAKDGVVTAELIVEDTEKADVEAYVEDQVAALDIDKEVESVETEKVVTVMMDLANATASLDVVRNVTVTLKDIDVTTTTTTGSTPIATGTTTTVSGETGENPGSETTTSDTGDNPGSETTTTESSETGSNTGSETTGTTETTESLPPATDVKAVEVELYDNEASNGVYFAHEESYNAADLIKSVTLVLNSVDENGDNEVVEVENPAVAIGFLTTPGEDYASAADEGYFMGEISVYYLPDSEKTPLDVHPVVGVAKKGDTTLDGAVDESDAWWTLMYNSHISAGLTDYTFTNQEDYDAEVNVLLEKLAYLVSDIDTERKTGKDELGSTENTISQSADAFVILMASSVIRQGQAKDDDPDFWQVVREFMDGNN